MAWNQPQTTTSSKPAKCQKLGVRVKLIAILAVLVLGGVGAWLILGPSLSEPSHSSSPGKESCDVSTNELGKANKHGEALVGKDTQTSASSRPVTSATNEVALVVTNASSIIERKKDHRIVRRKAKPIFHTMADVCISRVIGIKPGHPVIGTMNYDRFPELLKKALATPITFDKDDTDEDKALKQAVIETRKELKEAMDRGEDVAQIMRESEQELRRLYQYRASLSKDLATAMREKKFSAADMQDYIDAANKMLKDNGLEPLKHPQLWIRNLKLRESQPAVGK